MKRIISLFICISLFSGWNGIYNAGAEEFDRDVTDFVVSTPQPTEAIDYTTENDIKFYCEDYNDGVKMYIENVYTDNVIIPETIDGKTVFAVEFLIRGGAADALQFESIYFPDTVEYIDNLASNKKLKSVRLPMDLNEITNGLFINCTSLEHIEIPNNVTRICERAFWDCTSLKSVSLPEGLISIGDDAFHNTGLESVKMPSTVVKIGNEAFHVCHNLKSVNIPEGVTYIGDSAFSQTAISTVTIPTGIEYLGKFAFSGCNNLQEVNGLSKANMIKYWEAFNGTPWQKSLNLDDPFLVDTDGTLIAYAGDDSDIVIPDTVKIIGERACSYNDNIKQVTIPDSVTKISNAAFVYCHNIKAITIPASVTKIEKFAFSQCTQLKDVTLEASDTPLEVSDMAFQNTLISPETLITNGRKFRNQNVIFKQTAFDPDYLPVPESRSTEAPTATKAPQETEIPTKTEAPTTAPTASPLPETEKEELTVTSANGSIYISADRKAITFADAQPFIDENGRTQIPIRAVAEALGGTVEWDGETQTATIKKNNKLVVIQIGNANMQIDKKIITMDTTAQIIDERTYIPVRFVGEALGMTVNREGE